MFLVPITGLTRKEFDGIGPKCERCRDRFHIHGSRAVGAKKDLDSKPYATYYCGPCVQILLDEAAEEL